MTRQVRSEIYICAWYIHIWNIYCKKINFCMSDMVLLSFSWSFLGECGGMDEACPPGSTLQRPVISLGSQVDFLLGLLCKHWTLKLCKHWRWLCTLLPLLIHPSVKSRKTMVLCCDLKYCISTPSVAMCNQIYLRRIPVWVLDTSQSEHSSC